MKKGSRASDKTKDKLRKALIKRYENGFLGFGGKIHSEETKNKIRLGARQRWINEETRKKLLNGGMKGKRHTEETKLKMSGSRYKFKHTKEAKNKISFAHKLSYKLGRKVAHSKFGYREDLGHHVRSTWEANICRIIKCQMYEYKYEPKVFDLGWTTYTPDLFFNGEWYEIMGWERDITRKKIFSLKEKYGIDVHVIGLEQYRELREAHRESVNSIFEWED